jgi:cell division protein FtsI (penicillin-binding protein 3)
VASTTPRNSASFRLYLLAGILLLWCLVICARLVYLQIFCYGRFEQRAQHQQQRTEEVSARRGIIYDRQGRELAMSINVDSVFAVPTAMPKPATTIALVARITKQDPHELLARCEAAKTFCWLARKPDPEISARIRALNLRGVYFEKEPKRYYPKNELAAQVLGYVGMDDTGLSGIEREYEDRLHGRTGKMLISVDARKKWFASVEREPLAGENVVLTLDEKIQYIAERELEKAIAETHAESGTVIVENPHTGEILALANRPTFNPNLEREITLQRLKNHAVSDVYEPGSTFKLVTISAALNENLTSPTERFDCQMGSIVVFGRRIHDWHPFGVMPVSDILVHSSDVGAIKIALRLGEERMYKYVRAFGFGQATGIELPGETRGLSKPVQRWSKVSIGAIAMGQEIGISPLQLAAMLSSFANDGILVAPRIVIKEPRLPNAQESVAFHPVEERRAISTTTAALMRQMMQGVVLRGTGKKAMLEGYSSAGKTGTAQKVDPATHTYSRTKYIASFAGFAPVNNPAIVCVVILDSPVGGHHGGEVAAPVFHRIAQQVLEYLHTPNDVDLSSAHQELLARNQTSDKDLEEGSPDHLGETMDLAEVSPAESVRELSSDKPAANVLQQTALVARSSVASKAGPGRSQSSQAVQSPPLDGSGSAPSSSSGSASNQTVVVDIEQGGIVVPSFLGKSVRAAIELAEGAGLELDVLGSGLGEEQSPAAGTHVASGRRITVKFGR